MRRTSILATVLTATALYAGDRPADCSPDDFAGSVYSFAQGYVLAEAEDLMHSAKWGLRTDGPGNNEGGCGEASSVGYTGRGYLRWTGELLTCASLGAPEGDNHSDITQACQGSKADWLVVKIHSAAAVALNVYMRTRTYHQRVDGDNDWWRAHIGHSGQIDRGGNCHVRTYSWPDWDGEWRFTLNPGLNAVYVQGRSQGIGIDRIAVYALGRTSLALNPATPASVPGNTGVGSGSGAGPSLAERHQLSGPAAVYTLQGRRLDPVAWQRERLNGSRVLVLTQESGPFGAATRLAPARGTPVP